MVVVEVAAADGEVAEEIIVVAAEMAEMAEVKTHSRTPSPTPGQPEGQDTPPHLLKPVVTATINMVRMLGIVWHP